MSTYKEIKITETGRIIRSTVPGPVTPEEQIADLKSRLADAQAQSEQYRLETHRWADAAKKDREERDGLWKKIREAQARAERAEGEKLGLVVDCERLATDLEQALRQWKMYADERENEDLDKEDHIEALSYRSCVQTAKDWRDKAFSLTHPALTPAPQGRTDGERLEWMEKRTLFFHWFGGYKEVILQDYNGNKKFPSIRAAIDAAMDATTPEVKGGGE